MFEVNDWGDITSLVAIGSFILGSFYGITKFVTLVNELAKQVKEIDDSSSSTHKRIFDVTDKISKRQDKVESDIRLMRHDLDQAGITSIPNKYNKKESET